MEIVLFSDVVDQTTMAQLEATLPKNLDKSVTLNFPQYDCVAKYITYSNVWEISYPMNPQPAQVEVDGHEVEALGRALIAVIYL